MGIEMNIWRLLILCLLGVGSFAHAEGGTCPPGYYPQGGQGAMGCAPIPNYQGGASGSSPIERPQGHWKLTWGAIAMDYSGDVGVTVGKFSENDAKRDALARCATWGAKKCKIEITYNNQCAVIVKPMRDGEISAGTAVVQGGPSIEAATRLAMSTCGEKNETEECKVIYSDCTKPVLEY
ncbi:DUF4189 domain-containing protein [Pseudoxanthomonas yeongjuensis]|uniref:DUF4189 domain-containing protein n=1 Tax=Pseudoxanthomonas yeongjuensis TaxID=377616 RepID=UPI001FEBF3B8|nr:DUF4189 domain-containing protein [Pseudoxanthomonas yeongjuensis]